MNITLHQLRALKAVKDYGSITAAAHVLHITQPAVSNILKQLEQCYDYPLTETIGKKIFLTETGLRVVKASEAIQQVLDDLSADINALHGKLSGTMTVTIVSTAKYFVPRFLGEFRQRFPEVTIKLTVCNRQEAIHILKQNSSDILIMSQLPEGVAIENQLFYRDELIVVGSPSFKRDHKHTSLKDLAECDWIIREPGSGTRIVMQKLFKQHKMVPNIAMEVSNNESIKQLIIANMGISIVSRQSIELELQHNLLKILPVAGFPLKHPWYLVRNKGKAGKRIVDEFLHFVSASSLSN